MSAYTANGRESDTYTSAFNTGHIRPIDNRDIRSRRKCTVRVIELQINLLATRSVDSPCDIRPCMADEYHNHPRGGCDDAYSDTVRCK